MKNKALIFLSVAIIVAACSSSGSITQTAPTSTNNYIDTGHWVFAADRMLPRFGRTNTVTGGYNVTYETNKLVVYLPYTGRAYSGAGYTVDGNPLGFTSTNFTIRSQPGKKGRTIVTIIPADYSEVQNMIFTFFPNGNANLDITLANRSGISFTGKVDSPKK